jgi:heme exporter protein C
MIYAAYVMVRRATPIDQRATICAVICLFGMADVPIVYIANRVFRTQHPAPVLGGDENSGLAPDMLVTFLVANLVMLLLWWCIFRVRRRVERLERKLEGLTRLAHEVHSL